MLFNRCVDNTDNTSDKEDNTEILLQAALDSVKAVVPECDTVYITQYKIKKVPVIKTVRDTVTNVVYTDSLRATVDSLLAYNRSLSDRLNEVTNDYMVLLDSMHIPRIAETSVGGAYVKAESVPEFTYLEVVDEFTVNAEVHKIRTGLFKKPRFNIVVSKPDNWMIVPKGTNSFKFVRVINTAVDNR